MTTFAIVTYLMAAIFVWYACFRYPKRIHLHDLTRKQFFQLLCACFIPLWNIAIVIGIICIIISDSLKSKESWWDKPVRKRPENRK